MSEKTQPGRFRSVGLLLLLGFTALRLSAADTPGILREFYASTGNGSIAAFTNAANFPDNPTAEFIETLFEAPSNFADNYGQRMRALITAPTTGNYTFWIATDDQGELWLSTDDTPAHRRRIAYVATWTGSRVWNEPRDGNNLVQVSAPIPLEAGKRYYIEALQTEGGGGDNLAARWQLPDGTIEEPIPASRMVVYGLGPPIVTVQPTNVTVVEGGFGAFSISVAHAIGSTFQWTRNNAPIPDATNRTYSFGPVQVTDSTARFRCYVTNSFGWTNSNESVLTVLADTTKPTLLSAVNLGDPTSIVVTFSEPVETASATLISNYTMNSGVLINAITLSDDSRSVILTTTPMSGGIGYTVTVNNVRDRAATPNTILANSTRSFNLNFTPLDITRITGWIEPLGPCNRRTPLVFSEIMYHPVPRPDSRNLEFIELYNSQDYFEDISGFRVSGQVDYTFPTNTIMAAKSFIVLAASPADMQAVYGVTNARPYTNSLQNGSGTLRLRNRQDAVLLEAAYSDEPPFPTAADGAGHSLVLTRASLGEGDPRAWAASDLVGGSPGSNDVVHANAFRTVVINEFLAHTDPPDYDYVELFNYGSSVVNLGGCVLTDDPTTNKYAIPANTFISPRGFVVFDQNQLGFSLSAAGEKIFLKNPTETKIIDAVKFGAQENGVATGRYPDGAAGFYRLAAKTPGTNNAPRLQSDIVINEIMYDPISGNSADEYVELYNRGTNDLSLQNWRLTGGISFSFPSNAVIAAGAYLVVAKDAPRLMTNYPGLTTANTLGNFGGTLSHRGDLVALTMSDTIASTNSSGHLVTNTIRIAVDEVTYDTAGRWGKWSGGGGSSLELIDPRADHRLAPSWADSDESNKSVWTTVEATGVIDNNSGPAENLQMILLGPGECLVDNVEVIPQGGANLVANSDFESGNAGWFFQGNHDLSGIDNSGGLGGGRCLHIRASDRGDTGANRIRASLTSVPADGTTVTLRARVRWLKGKTELLLRLKNNGMEAIGYILTARNLGTPGAPNSRALANVGPAIVDVSHSPLVPAASAAVTVSARVSDPDGLSTLFLKYRVDPNTNFTSIGMGYNGAGLFSAVIPGQPAGATVAFFIQAQDKFSSRATTLFPNDAPTRECLVRFGDPAPPGGLGTYRLWMSQRTFDRWSSREKLSNEPLDCTFVYGNSRVIYNIGGDYAGSPYHAPGFDTPTGNVCDYFLQFPKDDLFLGSKDMTLQWPGNGGGDNSAQREETAFWIGYQLGLPYLHRRHVNLLINGVRRNIVFEDTQQPDSDMVAQWYPNGPNGDLYKIQLWFEFDDAASAFGANGAYFGNFTTTGGVKKPARYRWIFARRAVQTSYSDFTNLFNLVDTVNTPATGDPYITQLNAVADIDQWLRTYAVEHIVGNNDSFAYGGGQNMYMYRPDGDNWKLMIWDIDFAFASLPPDSDLFAGIGRSCGPDLSNPTYLRQYYRILCDAANGPLLASRANAIIDARYNSLTTNGVPADNPQSIKDYLAARRAYILTLVSNVSAPFEIGSNGGADFSTNNNLILLTGTAPVCVKTITVNGVAYTPSFSTITNWSLYLALGAGTNAITIRGYDSQGNLLAGASDTIQITYTGVSESPQGKVVINEIMYHPLLPNAGFVEILNTSKSNAFDLSGWELNGAGFVFPGGTVIAPGQYLVVAQNFATFTAVYGASIPVVGEFSGKLDNNGETLSLIKPGATPALDTVIDQVTYGSTPPWPPTANGAGPSLQLIDANQDNNRAGNWGVGGTTNPPPVPEWVFFSATGIPTRQLMYIYLQSAGDVYIDDLKMVPGSVPEAGASVVVNGDFESPLSGPWTVSMNHAASYIDTNVKHSGNSSLHLIANAGGTTQASSIWQTNNATINQTYTISFWYLQSTNGGPLTVRISGSGIVATVNPAPPGSGGGASSLYTPGAPNSIRATLPPIPPLWLNEIQPQNINGPTDRFGEHEPWVEIYNGGTSNVSLASFALTDTYTNLTKWSFPADAVINAGQFLVVWLDGQPAQSSATEWHTSFRIATNAGSLALVQLATNKPIVIDHLNYDRPGANRSYGSFPDGNASHRRTFSIVTPAAPNNGAPPPVNVLINEWMAENLTALGDPADGGDNEDWFELYNPSPAAADLSGFYLTDNLTDKTQWLIPNGTVIPAGGFLLVWADGETSQNGFNTDLHASFKLSQSGEAIGLFGPDGTQIDAVTFGPQTVDVSQGRFPDGAATIYFMTNSTPRRPNTITTPNLPPQFTPVSSQFIDEGMLLTLPLVATDPDGVAQTLTYSIVSAPFGADIDANTGVFTWTPTEAQGPAVHPVIVRVTDNGAPPLSASNSFTITVNEVNAPPTLAPIGNKSVLAGATLNFTAVGNDTDLPPQPLFYTLDPGAPSGAMIGSGSGAFSWTPPLNTPTSTNEVTIRVLDNGAPPLSATRTFAIVVVGKPSFISITPVGGGDLSLVWESYPGRSYQLQSCDALPGTWTNVGQPVLADSFTASLTDNAGAAPHRFYRVVVLD